MADGYNNNNGPPFGMYEQQFGHSRGFPQPMTNDGSPVYMQQEFHPGVYEEAPGISRYGPGEGSRLRRNNTLTKPERQRSVRRPLMRDPDAIPPAARVGATTHRPTGPDAIDPSTLQGEQELHKKKPFDWWVCCSKIMTCCCLPVCLKWGGMHEKPVQQAWREKVSLCMIILLMCAALGYLTFGYRATVCPENSSGNTQNFYNLNDGTPTYISGMIARGSVYLPATDASLRNRLNSAGVEIDGNSVDNVNVKGFYNSDITLIFSSSYCSNFRTFSASDCTAHSTYGSTMTTTSCVDYNSIFNGIKPSQRVVMRWQDVEAHSSDLMVFNGAVVNRTLYYAESKGQPGYMGANVDSLISASLGRDGTKTFMMTSTTRNAGMCLSQRYVVAYVDKQTVGCMSSMVVMIAGIVIILGVVFVKFFMAIAFSWIIAPKLASSRSQVAENQNSAVAGQSKPKSSSFLPSISRFSAASNGAKDNKATSDNQAKQNAIKRQASKYGKDVTRTTYVDDLYTMLLITCYSEGEAGIASTLESLCMTEYPDDRKLVFFVADGMITGSGEDRSTPDIILGLFDVDKTLPVEACSYLAVADGAKQHNMAKIYCGYYRKEERAIPVICVVKCGTPAEAKAAKPGNRGKRDSQLVIMNFLSRVMFDDRMTPMDFDLFTKIHKVAGVTPDRYEIILMVDADTVVLTDALRHMVNAMKNDTLIMGLCGETRINNKTASWVSMIQVFEYYINHHQAKAFESVFGGVTCLPGCFCMYRIKAPKGPHGQWVPVLVNPDIVEEYSENVVETLHKKNLLLLGEDRFLTTLMLRNFPKRKMIFVPQAMCRTVVPDQFKVLLSQRRRWINSTVHNLVELVLVRDLCGIFCFSMQFVVLLDVVGTVVLPAAICFTIYLIIISIVGTPQTPGLIMLAAILGLPGPLIIITTRELVYILWMMVYLLSLPVWNFVLPTYAFWHFDDFSWGETRKVHGDSKDDHGKKEGVFESSSVQLKRWHEWERERRLKQLQSRENSSTSTLFQPGNNSDMYYPNHSPLAVPVVPPRATVYGNVGVVPYSPMQHPITGAPSQIHPMTPSMMIGQPSPRMMSLPPHMQQMPGTELPALPPVINTNQLANYSSGTIAEQPLPSARPSFAQSDASSGSRHPEIPSRRQ